MIPNIKYQYNKDTNSWGRSWAALMPCSHDQRQDLLYSSTILYTSLYTCMVHHYPIPIYSMQFLKRALPCQYLLQYIKVIFFLIFHVEQIRTLYYYVILCPCQINLKLMSRRVIWTSSSHYVPSYCSLNIHTGIAQHKRCIKDDDIVISSATAANHHN